MAAIAHRRFRVALALLVFAACCRAADTHQDLLRQIAQVAEALSAGNGGDAMTPFDKSFKSYDKLSDYFAALTKAYDVHSEIEVSDEDIADSNATLTVRWTLSLKNTAGVSETRIEDLTVRLKMEKGKWRIVDLSPLEFFDPEGRRQ